MRGFVFNDMPSGIYKHKPNKTSFKKGHKPVGCSLKGFKHSEETKQKMRQSLLGKTGKNARNWKGGKIKKNCIRCEKEFWVKPCQKNIRKYCSQSCYHQSMEHLFGKNHYNWQGGKSFEPYSVDWTKTLKKGIRQRDKYICQICGKEPAIQVHHIDYDKKNCDSNNLITLCKGCHAKTNFNREYWLNYFQNNLIN